MKKLLSLFLFFLFCWTGLAAGGKGETASDPGTASGEGRSIKITYNIEKTNENTRSEGRLHVLAINGYVLPDVFDLVYAASTPYVFTVKREAWGDGGYVLDRNGKGQEPYRETDKTISDRDWELGWYEGNRRKSGTPRSWVYVRREGSEAFVSPDELDRYIAYKGFEERARDLVAPDRK
ncbi:MAG: hypothetical protein PQJ60_05320 [Spirochaetales bacterium]|nr:hypothetical protein [Spirochaetales bacterium]